MDDFTIISYPDSDDTSLLSLTESRSRYMLPFGGKFRVVDFTIRNSMSSGAKYTILYNKNNDNLNEYISHYGPFPKEEGDLLPKIKVEYKNFSNLRACFKLIEKSNTKYYIIYNGDHPSIIDFDKIAKRFKSKKTNALLFKLHVEDRPSMAYKILVIRQKPLLKILKNAIKEKRTSPNIFEMVINMTINMGIKKSSFSAYFWPIKSIPEYYEINREIIWNPVVFDLLFKEKIIQSQIQTEGYAHLGESSTIRHSFISDTCKIHGTVEDSIIFPGVEVEEGAVVKDSILLPYVKIGSGTKITRSIIDEGNMSSQDEEPQMIGRQCIIGSDEEFIKNSDFPESLFSSITLIGRNTNILDGSRIGGGCYVAPGLGQDYFMNKKYLYDGTSVVE